MTLTVENGTGVFGANSYTTVAFVLAYLTERGRETENSWSSASTPQQEGDLIDATAHIERAFGDRFRGAKQFRDISTAKATLEFTGQPANTETVTIGSTVYQFVNALAAAGDVLIGASTAASIQNLVDAVLATASQAGTAFHADTVKNPDATAIVGLDDTLVAYAATTGTAGNAVATTETVTAASWNSATMTGGSNVARPQPLSFPRAGLVDRDGTAIYGVPEKLQQAVAEYAVRARAGALIADPTADSLGGQVQRVREKVGPIETDTTYVGGTAQAGTVPSYPEADRLLREFLRTRGGAIRG